MLRSLATLRAASTTVYSASKLISRKQQGGTASQCSASQALSTRTANSTTSHSSGTVLSLGTTGPQRGRRFRSSWGVTMDPQARDPLVAQSEPRSDQQELSASNTQRIIALSGFAVAAVVVVVLLAQQGFSVKDTFQTIQDAIASHPTSGPLIFIAAYAIAAVVLIPASVLTLAAGFLFGPIYGTAIVSAAATLGATLAFLVSRYVARPLVLEKLGGNQRFLQISSNVAEKGPLVVLLLRLSPLVPYGLLNYMLGLTEVSLPLYIGCSWLGMLPGTLAYVYLGSIGQAAQSGLSPIKLTLYIIGGVATLGATKVISDIARKQLGEEESIDEGS